MFNVSNLVNRFQQLAVKAALHENTEQELIELVTYVADSAKAVSPADWKNHVAAVRGQLKLNLAALETHEPRLPNKLSDPMNHAQRTFYCETIARMNGVLEVAE